MTANETRQFILMILDKGGESSSYEITRLVLEEAKKKGEDSLTQEVAQHFRSYCALRSLWKEGEIVWRRGLSLSGRERDFYRRKHVMPAEMVH